MRLFSRRVHELSGAYALDALDGAERERFERHLRRCPGCTEDVRLMTATATALAQAKTFRFDMSDLAPAAFGGTAGQGEWKILQDFLKNPKDINGTASKLEAAAAAAYKK